MTSQDVANKLQGYNQTRQKNRDIVIDRVQHNQSLQDIINDLSLGQD